MNRNTLKTPSNLTFLPHYRHKIAKNKEITLHVKCTMLEKLIGKPPFSYDIAQRTESYGVATGLAVTSVGGDILFIEASAMPGK